MKPNFTDSTTQSGISTFHENLARLKVFLQENGRWPRRGDNSLLFDWMHNIRVKYKRGTLGEPFIKELDSIGFNWSIKEAKWYEMAGSVKRLLHEGEIPSLTKTPDLYGWLRNSLDQYRNKILTEDKRKIVEELQTIVIELSKQTPYKCIFRGRIREMKWEELYTKLVKFRKTHTKCWPRKSSGDNEEKELYRWCALMRQLFRKKGLSDTWKNKLNAIQFNFLEQDK